MVEVPVEREQGGVSSEAKDSNAEIGISDAADGSNRSALIDVGTYRVKGN